MLTFGDILINKAPEDTTDFLKEFCVSVKNQEGSIPVNPTGPQGRARPQDFLHLFLNKSEYLVTFLEHLIENQTSWSTQIYNALVEHYLVSWIRFEAFSPQKVKQVRLSGRLESGRRGTPLSGGAASNEAASESGRSLRQKPNLHFVSDVQLLSRNYPSIRRKQNVSVSRRGWVAKA